MEKKLVKRNLILGILFFLPVIFLLFLYPAQHNYNALEVVNENVMELNGFVADTEDEILLADHITVLGFLGKEPLSNAIAASNLKELVYDKFKGFKKFQVVMVVPNGTDDDIVNLKKEINSYEDLKYWHFVFAEDETINRLYNSLNTTAQLDRNLATQSVFIIDKERNQRGRMDDRSDNEVSASKPISPLISYDCIEVAEIKNKMSEDVRILFTEYRQKRKGKFDSSSRRADDLKGYNEQ